jgi:hypothetical protein
MKKLYLTKVNPFAQAKWQNKYNKKKKTNASAISGRFARNRRVPRDSAAGAEIKISVRVADENTRYVIYTSPAPG